MEVGIAESAISYRRYPFFPASVREHPLVEPSVIGEVNPDGNPPTIRLKREILFVPASQREELRHFARQNGIPVRRRYDVWEGLLQPFLDAEFDAAERQATIAELERHGVGRAEVDEVRGLVGRRMIFYTCLTWEWAHYGLYDVLQVMHPLFPGKKRFRRFYSRAMDLALRAYRD